MAFFCARKLQTTPRTQNHQLYLTADRFTSYSRSSLISYRAVYSSELKLLLASDEILVIALLICHKISVMALFKLVVTFALLKFILHSMHGFAYC